MLGLIYSIFPIGFAITSLVMRTFSKYRHRGIIFYIASIIAGVGLGLFGFKVPFTCLVRSIAAWVCAHWLAHGQHHVTTVFIGAGMFSTVVCALPLHTPSFEN